MAQHSEESHNNFKGQMHTGDVPSSHYHAFCHYSFWLLEYGYGYSCIQTPFSF